jgi:hypothetical protein
LSRRIGCVGAKHTRVVSCSRGATPAALWGLGRSRVRGELREFRAHHPTPPHPPCSLRHPFVFVDVRVSLCVSEQERKNS